MSTPGTSIPFEKLPRRALRAARGVRRNEGSRWRHHQRAAGVDDQRGRTVRRAHAGPVADRRRPVWTRSSARAPAIPRTRSAPRPRASGSCSAYRRDAAAFYVNRQGRSVDQILSEETLRREIGTFLDSADFSRHSPEALRKAIRDFVGSRSDLQWALEPAEPPSLAWRIRNVLHLVEHVGIALLATPARDPAGAGPPGAAAIARESATCPTTSAASAESVNRLRSDEDFWVHNQVIAAGLLQARAVPAARHDGDPANDRLRLPAHLQPRFPVGPQHDPLRAMGGAGRGGGACSSPATTTAAWRAT